MLQDGEISENDFASLEFVTDRAKRSYLQKVQAELEREREARQNIEARFELFQQEREKERADQDIWRKNMEEMVKTSERSKQSSRFVKYWNVGLVLNQKLALN
ncbi:uncharacterized protein LOC110905494 [Helianthus annuus]|uniref:uncharacterized protein LOC110905494 n=1 Tax=Helianthus annuus TaxID=4232 RepID=UPI000B8EFEBF|nr:uncharacterized protein LOC110905494 [Helianthus annuus]